MTTWKIDPSHSEVTFKVKHLVISNVTGNFKKFDGKLKADREDFSDAVIEFTADIDSIHTGSEQRDGHLKSADFFDAANHPQLKFISTSFVPRGDGNYDLNGNLTIRGNSQPVTLKVEFGGIQQDFYGNTVAGFEISGKIHRLDFGLHWNGVTEAGHIVVSNEVKLSINVEMIKETVAKEAAIA